MELACDQCGYSLQGLPQRGRCPECGRSIEWAIIVVREQALEAAQRGKRDVVLWHISAGLLLLNGGLAIIVLTGLIDPMLLILYAIIILPIIAFALAVVQFGQMLGRLHVPCFGWVPFACAEAAMAASALIALGFTYRMLADL